MDSYGLVAVIVVVSVAALLISIRVATIAMRLVRQRSLKRTTAVLPAVRPEPHASSVVRGSRRGPPQLPIHLVAAHPTLPPERDTAALRAYRPRSDL